MPVLDDAPIKREWSARLDLEYELRGTETVLMRREHVGPLRVQRPFLEASGVCQTYVIHPPGGVVGGDILDVRVRVQEGARALLTTPGATKFYRSPREAALQKQQLYVAPRASLEWFPQETIIFDGALAAMQTHVELHESSACALWEVTCLGRPAGNQRFTSGLVNQRLEVRTERRPLLLESLLLESPPLASPPLESGLGGAEALHAPWGFQGLPVYGTMLLHPLPKELLARAREAVSELWSPRSEHRFGASQLPYSEQQSTIVCRYLGTSAEYCKLLFIRVWRALRPHLLGIEAEPPRVWHT
jgi:urease accessory protein